MALLLELELFGAKRRERDEAAEKIRGFPTTCVARVRRSRTKALIARPVGKKWEQERNGNKVNQLQSNSPDDIREGGYLTYCPCDETRSHDIDGSVASRASVLAGHARYALFRALHARIFESSWDTVIIFDVLL